MTIARIVVVHLEHIINFKQLHNEYFRNCVADGRIFKYLMIATFIQMKTNGITWQCERLKEVWLERFHCMEFNRAQTQKQYELIANCVFGKTKICIIFWLRLEFTLITHREMLVICLFLFGTSPFVTDTWEIAPTFTHKHAGIKTQMIERKSRMKTTVNPYDDLSNNYTNAIEWD